MKTINKTNQKKTTVKAEVKAEVKVSRIELEGVAFYEEQVQEDDKTQYGFLFAPDKPLPDNVKPFRAQGVAQQMRDGTFDFISVPRKRAKSELILKLAHGRASKTKDGAIMLTIKVFTDENINIPQTIGNEAVAAVEAIQQYQLKH